jgi:hypothetical protein
MTINQKDIKLLWGRSGNRCAICKTELTQNKESVTAAFTLGEQAHIVGEKEEASRGKSLLSLKERNSYHNLILLCPNHHTQIDENEEDWPVEKLHQIKSEHELWVTETLSETVDHVKLAKQTILSSIVDAAVSSCRLEEWQNWTSFALAPDPEWPKELPDEIFEFRKRVIAAIWPDEFQEIKRAAVSFSILLHRAAQLFLKHSETHGDRLYPFKFYNTNNYNENYDKDLQKYREWIVQCHQLIREATKAANWFADVVRQDVNPMFFAEKGKFLVMEGPFMDMSFRTVLLEFSEAERNGLPDSLHKSV